MFCPRMGQKVRGRVGKQYSSRGGRGEGQEYLKISTSVGIHQRVKSPGTSTGEEGRLVPGPQQTWESKAEQSRKAGWGGCLGVVRRASCKHKTTLNRFLALSQQGGASVAALQFTAHSSLPLLGKLPGRLLECVMRQQLMVAKLLPPHAHPPSHLRPGIFLR